MNRSDVGATRAEATGRRMTVGLLAALLAIVSLIAAVAVVDIIGSERTDVDGLTLLTYEPTGIIAAGVGQGRLEGLHDCVALVDPDGAQPSAFVIWPDGFAIDDAGVEAKVLNEEGEPVASIGDDVTLGGGFMDESGAEAVLQAQIPQACVSQGVRYFVTSGVLS